MHCTNCQVPVAWSLMADAESPATLFELLKTHFLEPPRRIVYDNGCNLLQYALNREPLFLLNTQICIDELHYKGHRRCAKAFDSGIVLLLMNTVLSVLFISTAYCSSGYLTQVCFHLFVAFIYTIGCQVSFLSYLRVCAADALMTVM